MSETPDKAAAVIAWLADGARNQAEAPGILAELCDRLAGAGVPLWRVAVFVRTLHPQAPARRFLWRPDAPVEVSEALHEQFATDEFVQSPIVRVSTDATPIRRRLADPACPLDFAILAGLRAEGVTDYLVSPLAFSNGEVHVVSWSTRAPGGFGDAQLVLLEAIAAPFARVAEVRALRRTAMNLMNTYVGNLAGQRILSGQIRRGHTESIYAAIWLSDMRGFTKLADRVRPETLIEMLNLYFDCQVGPILEHGGEVLKFMGDGLLAIFPVAGEGSDAPTVCNRAMAAAFEARGKVAALGNPLGIPDYPGPRMGVALHLGAVLYGNIGGGNRLDFTCIGPAVNLAARVEKLTGKLGRTVLVSEDFQRFCRTELVSMGEHALAGFAAPQIVYGLADEAGMSA